MIDSIRGVLSLAGSYVSWETFGLWVAFVLSFPVALLLLGALAFIWVGSEESSLEDRMAKVAAVPVILVGIPASGILFYAAWNAIDVVPPVWKKYEGLGFLWLLVKAIAGHWMRLIYSALPIGVVFLPFLVYLVSPGINKRIQDEKEETKRARGQHKAAGQRVAVVENPADMSGAAAPSAQSPPPHGLVPDPPDGEKLPEGWTYRPETPGGH